MNFMVLSARRGMPEGINNTSNVGIDPLLSKGQASVHHGQSCVHGGHTFVQALSKYLRLKKNKIAKNLRINKRVLLWNIFRKYALFL